MAASMGGDGPVLVFVGLDRLVGPDPEAQARLTVEILLALGTLFLLFALWRRRQERIEDEDDEEGSGGQG